jgi:hypothetical protein
MQKVRRHPFPDRSRDIGLRPLVGTWFQVLFTPLDGVLFTFQSPYWFTIGRWRVLSLGRWASLLHTEFHEHRATLGHRTERLPPVAYGAFTPCGGPFQILRLGRPFSAPCVRARNPSRQVGRFGLVPVRSPLLRESLLFSFPGATGMFYFTPFVLNPPYFIQAGMLRHDPQQVVPSEIPGSTPDCGSPRLIAACRVLCRRLAPRHPPCTLSSLTAMDRAPASRLRRATARYASSSNAGYHNNNLRCHFLSTTIHFSRSFCGDRPAAGTPRENPISRTNDGGGERIRTVDFRLAKPALSR